MTFFASNSNSNSKFSAQEANSLTLDSARGRTLESARGAPSLDGSMMNESIKYKNTDGDTFDMGDDANGEDDGSNSEEGKY